MWICCDICWYDQMYTWRYSGNVTSTKHEKGVPQSQTAALRRHQEEEETDKSKQAQIEQTYEKHED